MTAASACRTCGTEPRERARFCDACGSSIGPASEQPEYKQVTVLFADVVHSMDIAATVGPERLREIMADLVDRCAAVVRRYGGTVGSFTGDGIMALFGAPVALEDHAFRACLAALDIQDETTRLAAEAKDRDGISLWLRVGLNSGRVIAGEFGSGPFGYTAIGEHVGMAQRMESVAPPGGVMLSASTARLVEGAAVLGEPETVHIKGAESAVPSRRLLSMAAPGQRIGPSESTLVGRESELAVLAATLEQSIGGHGSVVGVVGPAGIGKTRLTREAVQLATSRGVEVFGTFCESHTTDIPFRVVARLLRAITQVNGLDDQNARMRLRARNLDADPEDMLLLDDLMGIADPDVQLPKIDPDARRRRLTALVNAAQLARSQPAMFVVEDVHWIDEVSESMLADFLAVIAQAPSMVMFSYRPEYRGVLGRVDGAQTITLDALNDSESSTLIAELLGPDPSVGEIAKIIAGRAAGNPFFAEEITRELAERGVLVGERGGYTCRTEIGEVGVPATLQATIAARIDRLPPAAKRTLAAAAVMGSRFSSDLLTSLEVDPSIEELINAELIDQMRFTPRAEYAFRHPLFHAVAYESQLKSDRARLHRRLAAAIEAGDPESAEENAAMIAEHLYAAGELYAAYGWHMRAGAWATNRDITAARLSWEHARKIADSLAAEDSHSAALRIAPLTMLCASAFRVRERVTDARFDELRELCAASGDKASLAIAMAGLVIDHAHQDRIRAASRLASEAWALVEAVGDATLTVGLSAAAIYAKFENAEWSDVLLWSQAAIDLADDDPSKGNFIFGSPLAVAFTYRGIARYCLGGSGWRDDLRHGLVMARSAEPQSYATVAAFVYVTGIPLGVLRPDDPVMHEIEDALEIAERSGDDLALAFARLTLGIALVHRGTDVERDRGRTLLAEVKEVFVRGGHNLCDLPIVDVYLARERARRGDRDETIPVMRAATDHLFCEGRLLGWGIAATGVLVETLLDAGSASDVAEAEAAIERLAAAPADGGLVIRDIWLLRLRALLARAHRDAGAYLHSRNRYGDMATTFDFDGHVAWAEAMPGRPGPASQTGANGVGE
ncbi:MAG TPA: adenylate/guanylate cyclase domain-containing protein [Mycobacterium sp.]